MWRSKGAILRLSRRGSILPRTIKPRVVVEGFPSSRKALAQDSLIPAAMASMRLSDTETARVTSLRSMAQEHLQEIGLDQGIEQEKDTRRLAELEREARRRGATQTSNRASSADLKQKAGRMRTAGGEQGIEGFARVLTRTRRTQSTSVGRGYGYLAVCCRIP